MSFRQEFILTVQKQLHGFVPYISKTANHPNLNRFTVVSRRMLESNPVMCGHRQISMNCSTVLECVNSIRSNDASIHESV